MLKLNLTRQDLASDLDELVLQWKSRLGVMVPLQTTFPTPLSLTMVLLEPAGLKGM